MVVAPVPEPPPAVPLGSVGYSVSVAVGRPFESVRMARTGGTIVLVGYHRSRPSVRIRQRDHSLRPQSRRRDCRRRCGDATCVRQSCDPSDGHMKAAAARWAGRGQLPPLQSRVVTRTAELTTPLRVLTSHTELTTAFAVVVRTTTCSFPSIVVFVV